MRSLQVITLCLLLAFVSFATASWGDSKQDSDFVQRRDLGESKTAFFAVDISQGSNIPQRILHQVGLRVQREVIHLPPLLRRHPAGAGL